MSSISGVSGNASAWSAMSTSRASRQQEMFKKVDSDGSGSVDATELQSMFDDIAKHTGTAMSTTAADALSKMDSNGDGSLDASELDKGMKSLMPQPSSTMAFAQARNGEGGPPPPPPSDGTSSTSSSSIDPLDTNKDGVVSEQERAAGEADIQAILQAADTDGDKKISASEFDKFKDMLSNAVSDLSSSGSSSTSTQSGSSGAASSGDQGFNLSTLTNMVLKEYAKAASAAASQQSVGATLSVAA
jgi:Ca2+-binding EF-hand superfamily protein